MVHLLSAIVTSAIIAIALATPADVAKSPKLLICSDSTTANYTGGNSQGLQGWGYFIGQFFSIPVKNLAHNGRSTRSFIQDGEWKALLSQTSPGDFILIEMGHNDAADPRKGGKYVERGTIPGIGEETAIIQTSRGMEQVYTFGHYLRSMIADTKAAQAIPVISGMVPTNSWEGGKMRTVWHFTDDARKVAEEAKVEFVDHTKFSVVKIGAMGPTKAKTLFPNDNTHTNPQGALLNAETFVEAVQCAGSGLKKYLNGKGQAIKAPC